MWWFNRFTCYSICKCFRLFPHGIICFSFPKNTHTHTQRDICIYFYTTIFIYKLIDCQVKHVSNILLPYLSNCSSISWLAAQDKTKTRQQQHRYIFHVGVNKTIWGRVIHFALIVFNTAQQMRLSKINHLHLVVNTHTYIHTHWDTDTQAQWLLHAFIIEFGFCYCFCCCFCCSCSCCFDVVCPSWQVGNRWPMRLAADWKHAIYFHFSNRLI